MSSFFQVIESQEEKWKQLITKYISPDARLVACSSWSGSRRVYLHKDLIYKVTVDNEAQYLNTLENEHSILKIAQITQCVPIISSFVKYDDCTILAEEQCLGNAIGQFTDTVSLKEASIFKIIYCALRLNFIGISHGDLKPNNLIIKPNGDHVLIDFDQASILPLYKALLNDFLGIGKRNGPTVLKLIKQIFLGRYQFISKLFRKKRRGGSQQLMKNTSLQDQTLADIWIKACSADANAPGEDLCYYSVFFRNCVYIGERPWEPRWHAINAGVTFKGKRLLELGCNLGLLSCYALNAGGLPGGLAIDNSERIISCARKFSEFTESKINHAVIDFDSQETWENSIDINNFQIVSLLSVLNWIKSKKRLLNFISQFPECLYEGHDSLFIECSRLRSCGFSRITVVSVSERGRPVLLAQK